MDKTQIIKKLKCLKQYANVSDQDLEKIAEKYLNNEILQNLVFANSKEEKKLAEKLLEQYINEWDINSFSDKNTLIQLIDLELLNYKIKKKINEIEESSKTETYSGVLAKELLEQLLKNTEEILRLKESLGLTKAEKEKTQSDLVSVLETLKRRFKDWINKPENKSSYTVVCPHCQKYFLIRRRLDKEKDEVLSHPFFVEGGITFNKHLFKLYKSGKITKEDVANVLDTSPDYVDWIMNKFGDELC